MEKLPKEVVITYEERVACVVWAAHILSYLTSKRSHAEPHQHDVDTEEFENCGTDYGTDETVVLTNPNESVRQKFLDGIAQLLSSSKGWDGVTAAALREREDFVELDVARNDCFISNKNGLGDEVTDYCKKLEQYLGPSARGKNFWIVVLSVVWSIS